MSIITTGDIPSLLRPGLDEVGVVKWLYYSGQYVKSKYIYE